MFCSTCGAQNDDNVYHCASCGSPVRAEQAAAGLYPPPADGPTEPKPNNWLIPAILVTTPCGCGCWPLGVVAIVFAAQVDGKYHQGDYQGAVDAARKAKMFTLIALILGVVCIGAAVVLQVFGLLLRAPGLGF
jgi:DNA-directed RNA polymerase subunit RPC12/RpoP